MLDDLNNQANASKHADLGPGRFYRPSLEGQPHPRKVMIVSGLEGSGKWKQLTELVALSAGELDADVVGSFFMEGKATSGPYVAVQSGRAVPLSTPALISGRCAGRGPPVRKSRRSRSASVARRSLLPRYDGGSDSSAPTSDGRPSSPSLGTAQEGAGHSSPTLGGDHLRGRANKPPPIVADPPKVSSWQTVAFFDGNYYGQDYLCFSAGKLVELLRHPLEDDGWAYGRLLETQKKGWLPRSFVNSVENFTRREEFGPPHNAPLSDLGTRVLSDQQDRGGSSAQTAKKCGVWI